jgi:hypothetical protein
MSYNDALIQWDVCCTRGVQDWDVDSITEFMDFLYTVNIRQHVPDVMCWNPSPRAIFEVKSF